MLNCFVLRRAEALDAGEDDVGGLGPAERLRIGVVGGDERRDGVALVS